MKTRKTSAKRVLSVMALMTIACVQGMAQSSSYPEFMNENFTVEIPSLDKLVKVTTDDVNIRKEPNAKSPRLVTQFDEDGCMDCPATIVWLNRPLKKNENAASPSEDEVFPLIEESGDWYKIQINDYRLNYLNTPAYIMKKFCKVEKTRPLTLPSPEWINVVMVKTGKYTGLCLQCYVSDFEDVCDFRLGKYTNGMFVFPYSIRFQTASDKKIRFVNDGDYKYLSIDESMVPFENGNLTKFTAEKYLDLFMNNLNKMNKNSTYIYYGAEGDEYWHSMEIYKLE